ncbi:hypothetical protein [Mucilaginibacter paludis]|uniref:Uncharacterized protein n=1 Tax=Mucilaginibacter paludis DSM 18603 TaxID=714943 RepID=H1Y909_9SPHI|nr:hypothetical protein [Mucilaginibacter paludis]EHQ29047.1 hypothetical protein Mucpa_4965 [Mucilaginibacter paludis DSM 18603]
MKKIVFGLILLLVTTAAPAQHLADAAGLKQLKVFEDSLKVLGNRFINDENELERKNANYKFIKTLVSALKVPGSYHYAFDSLKNISLINAPDNRFRIMAWHVLNNDGSYRFYGAIQMNSAVLKLYPLEDYSPLLKNPEDSVTDNRKWFGAQYYKIIQPDAALPYYTLLGWKGNTIKTTKKVIEVLSFSNGKPVLGMRVFTGNGKIRRRVVFEYARQASMLLKYNADSHLIVFDHLAASDPKTKGKMETYGPDMSYSGYQFKLGKWVFVDNLDMRNIPDTNDEQYVDPKKQLVPDKTTVAKKRTRQ